MNIFLKQSYSDVDAFNEKTIEWQPHFHQLDCGPFLGTLFQYGYEDAIIGNAWFSRKINQHGGSPPGRITFAILFNGETQIIWRGNIVDKQMVMVYLPGDEIDCSSLPGFQVATYSISEKRFLEHCHSLGFPDLLTRFKNKRVFSVSLTSRLKTIKLIEKANSIASFGGDVVDESSFRTMLEVQIACQFIEVIAGSRNIVRQSPITTRSQKALKLIEKSFESVNPPKKVRDLCELTGLSERTLQYLFRWKFDMTPMTYLKRMRLNAVHRSLRRTSQENLRVADAANKMGFWHMGQFAQDYRELFGELPKDTLKRI